MLGACVVAFEARPTSDGSTRLEFIELLLCPAIDVVPLEPPRDWYEWTSPMSRVQFIVRCPGASGPESILETVSLEDPCCEPCWGTSNCMGSRLRAKGRSTGALWEESDSESEKVEVL